MICLLYFVLSKHNDNQEFLAPNVIVVLYDVIHLPSGLDRVDCEGQEDCCFEKLFEVSLLLVFQIHAIQHMLTDIDEDQIITETGEIYVCIQILLYKDAFSVSL